MYPSGHDTSDISLFSFIAYYKYTLFIALSLKPLARERS